MHIKFFSRGTGGGRGPTEYLTDEVVRERDPDTGRNLRDDQGNPVFFRRDPPAEVLRGNPGTTRRLIDHITNKYRYTSGVVAFHADDAPTEEQQQKLMDDFERLAFAGLESDQYDILWVRHRHEGNTELHMVVPRVELSTGKALNIAPPGYSEYFDELRDAWNYENGWARPDDLARSRLLTTPPTYGKPVLVKQAKAREQITEWLRSRVSEGAVTDRAGIVASLEELGEVTRQGKDYISVKPKGFLKAVRLKGAIYGEEFDASSFRELVAEASTGPGAVSKTDIERAEEARTEFASWIERRAGYHTERYQRPNQRNHGFDREPGNTVFAVEQGNHDEVEKRPDGNRESIKQEQSRSIEQLEMGVVEVQPTGVDGLNRHLSRELGLDALDVWGTGENESGNRSGSGNFEQLTGWSGIRNAIGRTVSDLQRKAGSLSGAIRLLGDEIKESVRTGYDRVRDEINRLVESVGSRIERARAAYFGADGQLATAGIQLSTAGGELEQASNRLDQSVRTPGHSMERGMAKLMENRNDELERFKRDISLPEYAASQGYQVIRSESSRNSYVMERESDKDKIIVATASDGHGIYFSVRDHDDNGSIIDFAQRRKKLNLGQTRKELRPWIGSASLPVPQRIKKPVPSTADRQKVLQVIARSQPAGTHEYLVSRGIHPETLKDARLSGVIRRDQRGNALFPHYDREGLSGYEVKNQDFTGFASGGKKSLWYSTNLNRSERLVIAETAIDALSHAEAVGLPGDAYGSFAGSMSLEQLDVLKSVLNQAHEAGRTLVIATDNDKSGADFEAQLRELAPEGMTIERDAPAVGNDWNDSLTHYIENPRKWAAECRVRGIKWPRHGGSGGGGTELTPEPTPG